MTNLEPFALAFTAVLIAALIAALVYSNVNQSPADPTPAGWSCTKDIAPRASCNIYILTSPDGQLFLVNSKGGITPYTPRAEKKP